MFEFQSDIQGNGNLAGSKHTNFRGPEIYMGTRSSLYVTAHINMF